MYTLILSLGREQTILKTKQQGIPYCFDQSGRLSFSILAVILSPENWKHVDQVG